MSKHTPGPWRKDGTAYTRGRGTFIRGANGHTIALVFADIDLVLAAPELLEELKALAQAWDDVMESAPNNLASRFEGHHWQALCDTYDSAQATIAKAESAQA